MCDYGRFLAESLNQRDVEQPTERRDGESRAVTWAEALDALHALLADDQGAVAVASANLSNEALFLVHSVLVEQAGLEVVVPIDPGDERKIKNGRGEWLHNANAHPNSTGARLIGLKTVDQEGLESFLTSSSGPVLILDADAHPWLAGEAAAQLLKNRPVAVLARASTAVSRAARLVLPRASWIETEGTYTSSTGRVQLAHRGFAPGGQARPVYEIISLLGQRYGLGEAEEAVTPRTIFERLVGEIPAFAGVTYRRLAVEPGVQVLDEEVADVG
jgi:NADH dehydrogenase/NADH:ubiquinone oxidoreductase subunit G